LKLTPPIRSALVSFTCLAYLSKFSATWAASSRVGQRTEGARHPGAGAALREARDHREHEGGGLARAGLGDAQHVAPFERGGDGVGLDRRGRDVARVEQGLEHAGVEVEVGKLGQTRS
jgi:hypothetical protein